MQIRMCLGTVALILASAVSVTPASSQNTRDALADGVMSICADPYIYPSSSQGYPPGYDIDILEAIARMGGYRSDQFWVNSGTIGGLGRALRNSIAGGYCDVFIGVAVDDRQIDELAEKDLVFTLPYMALAFVPVVQGPAADAKSFEDLKGIKIGVSRTTPMDGYLLMHGFDREIYMRNDLVMEGMVRGEVDAAMLWSPSLGLAHRDFADAEFHPILNYKPDPLFTWNVAMIVPRTDTKLKTLVDNGSSQLLDNGEIQAIVEKYGVPYFAPVDKPDPMKYRTPE